MLQHMFQLNGVHVQPNECRIKQCPWLTTTETRRVTADSHTRALIQLMAGVQDTACSCWGKLPDDPHTLKL
jgi:hypothetical protein